MLNSHLIPLNEERGYSKFKAYSNFLAFLLYVRMLFISKIRILKTTQERGRLSRSELKRNTKVDKEKLTMILLMKKLKPQIY
jgi:hypothetical protein